MSRPFTFEDDVLLMACYTRRDPLAEIAARLGRSARSVSQRFSRIQRKQRIRERSAQA